MGKPSVSTFLLMVIPWMVSLPVVGEEVKKAPVPLAAMSVSPTRIDWRPAAHGARPAGDGVEKWVLAVTGPDEFFIRREFKAGQTPFLSVFDSEGDRLPDGSYTWELKALAKGPITRRESGAFAIQDGSFVEPPEGTGGGAKPPLGPLAKNFVETGSLVVQQNACIGSACSTTDADFSALKIKSDQPYLLFDDVAVPEGGSTSTHDWALLANFGDVDRFSIVDFTNVLFPVNLAAGAPTDSLDIAGNGFVGLGTASPAEHLHVFENADSKTRILVENPNGGVNTLTGLRLQSGAIADFKAHGTGRTLVRFGQGVANWGELSLLSGNGLLVGTLTSSPVIFGTNDANRMEITAGGNVGIGTASPSAHLQVSGSAGTNLVLVEETSGTTASRALLQVKNNGGPFVVYSDSSLSQTWATGSVGTSFMIDETAARPNAAEFVLSNTGNLTIAGTLTQGSDRFTKREIEPIEPQEVLEKLARLPIVTWNRNTDPPTVRHMGPMAQDFAAIFGLGEDDLHIATIDMAGVSMAAIQALHATMEAREAEVAALRRENADLGERVKALERLVDSLVKASGSASP